MQKITQDWARDIFAEEEESAVTISIEDGFRTLCSLDATAQIPVLKILPIISSKPF